MDLVLGIDVVDIHRFAQALQRVPRLNQRIFTASEQVLPLESRAARFAAKEALAKALGAPRGLRWHDVEMPLTGRKPKLSLSGTAVAEAERQGVQNWQVSLSHDAGIAIAIVIGVTGKVGLAVGASSKLGETGVLMSDVMAALKAAKIVPVVVVDGADEGLQLADALIAGGLPVAEVTLRLPGAMDAIRAISEQRPEIILGAGTVVTAEQAEEAVKAGAKYLVSPGTFEPVIRKAQELGVPILPGVATPSDVMRAVDLGLDTVKLFPAGVVGGPAAIKAFSGPFPNLSFMPTGGVSTGNIAEYFAIPAVIAVGGSWMVERGLVTGGKWEEITELTKQAVAKANELRP